MKQKLYLFCGLFISVLLFFPTAVKAQRGTNFQPAVIDRAVNSRTSSNLPRVNKNQPKLKLKKKKAVEKAVYKTVINHRRLILEKKRAANQNKVKNLLQQRQQFFRQIKKRFQANLEKIRDERKKRIIVRIEKRLHDLNQRIINQMNHHLDRLEALLTKIESRTAKITENGLDASSANEAIKNIQADIDRLRDKLTEQAGKSYTPQITDESGLRIAAGQSYQSLRQDFKELHHQLIKIRKETADLLHSLAQLQAGKK